MDLSGTLRAANLPVGMPPQAGAGGIGGLLAVEDSTGTTEESVYFYDGNGNVSDLVDSTNSTASVVAHYEYTPYGSVYSSTGTYADANTFRFSTKQFDAGTDLYYYGYRYYHANIGRWLNRDPIGENGGQNVYAFVANDPIAKADVLGQWYQVLVPIGRGIAVGIGTAAGAIGIHEWLDESDNQGKIDACIVDSESHWNKCTRACDEKRRKTHGRVDFSDPGYGECIDCCNQQVSEDNSNCRRSNGSNGPDGDWGYCAEQYGPAPN